MAVPSKAELPNARSSGMPHVNTSDVQAEAEARAIYLRAKLAQLRAAYVDEKDGVLPPLAVPRPASLQIGPRISNANQSTADYHLPSDPKIPQSTSVSPHFSPRRGYPQ